MTAEKGSPNTNQRAFIEGEPVVHSEPNDVIAQARAQTAQRLLSELDSVRVLFEENLIPASMFEAAASDYKTQMIRFGLTDLIVAPTAPITRQERMALERGNVGEKGLTSDRIQALKVLVEVEDAGASDIIDLLGKTRLGRRFSTSQASSSLKTAVNRLIRDQKAGNLSDEAAELYDLLNDRFSDPETGEFKEKIFEKIDAWRQGGIPTRKSEKAPEEQAQPRVESRAEEVKDEIKFEKFEIGILAEFMLSKMGTSIRNHIGVEVTFFRIPSEIVQNILADLKDLAPRDVSNEDLRKLRESTIAKVCEVMGRKELGAISSEDERLKDLLKWLHGTLLNDPFLKTNFSEFLSRRPDRIGRRKVMKISKPQVKQTRSAVKVQPESDFERRLAAFKKRLDEQA